MKPARRPARARRAVARVLPPTGRLHQRHLGGDFDPFLHRACTELHVGAGRRPHSDWDTGERGGFVASLRNSYAVGAKGQLRGQVLPYVIGGASAGEARVRAEDLYLRACNGRAGAVGDGANYASPKALRYGGTGENEYKKSI